MIAAAGRRARRAGAALRGAPGAIRRVPSSLPDWTRRADRGLDRMLERARPRVRRWMWAIERSASKRRRVAGPVLLRWRRRAGRRLRPAGVFVLRAVAAGEKAARRGAGWTAATVKRIRGVMTPKRVALALLAGSALALVVSQFMEYRAIEIGQPGYAGLPAAQPPTVGGETAGQAHAYLLVPLALLAGWLALRAIRRPRAAGLGLTFAALGLAGLAVVLLIDLPAGLDEGAAASRFSGATATLRDGFFIELAGCVGLILGGLLYYARPCRTRINLYARAASGLRRRPRRRASSRGRATRSGSPRHSAAASAPASRP